MKIRIAYIEEPPFYWTGTNDVATGADIELADVILRLLGATSVEHQLTTFEELLPGVQQGRWDMNVPIFITPDRSNYVSFSDPVWAIGDGFLLRHGNPKSLTSYKSAAARTDARLGLVTGTVQIDAAKSAGVSDDRIVIFKDQPAAIEALLAGSIDAYVATAVGNRAIADKHQTLEAVAHEQTKDWKPPFGGFSFRKDNHRLVDAVNEQLRKYLGSADHRSRMAKYGITDTEIDAVISL